MDPIIQSQLLSQQEAEKQELEEKLQATIQQVERQLELLAEEREALKPLNEALAAKTVTEREKRDAFSDIDSLYTKAISAQAKAKKAKSTVDANYKVYGKHFATLEEAQRVLTSEGGYAGASWYFPRGFKLEDVLACFTEEVLVSFDEEEERPSVTQGDFRAYNKNSQAYHNGNWVTKKSIDFTYANAIDDDSPRLLLLKAIESRLGELSEYIETYAKTSPRYQALEQELHESDEAVLAHKEQHEEAKLAKEGANGEFERAREAYNKQLTKIEQFNTQLKKLESEKKLYETYWLPLNEKLFTELKHTPTVIDFVERFDSDSGSEIEEEPPTLGELVAAYEENKCYLDDALAMQKAYDEFDFEVEKTGFRDRLYADDSLNCIEEEELFTTFKTTVLEVHHHHCQELPKSIEKLQLRQQTLLKAISTKQAEIKSKEAQANQMRCEVADKYLPKARRSAQQDISGINELGRLDSYISQRNATYAGWDMFAGLIKQLTRFFSWISCCPCVMEYQPDKEVREEYVHNVKENLLNWRENRASNLKANFENIGIFKERRDKSMPLSTLQQNMRELSKDVKAADALMPSDEELELANRTFAIS